MTRLESRISIGNISQEATLGGYYLDFRRIIPVVESAEFGPIDPDGVPLTRTSPGEHIYNTITISQYALALHDAIVRDARSDLEPRLARQLEAVLSNTERDGDWEGFCIHRWNNPKYKKLEAPWVSALAQGNAISALLRGHQLFGEKRYADCATKMFAALERPLDQGGVHFVDRCGHDWFEEFPMDPPSHVLNGLVFTLWGILDFARATADDRAWAWWRSGVETLRAHLPDFDCGFWSLYDLRYRELASLYYHWNVHIPQIDAMYGLTGEPSFERYASRWRRFGQSRWRRGLWWIALRVRARSGGMRFD
jgi:hypothetical protein